MGHDPVTVAPFATKMHHFKSKNPPLAKSSLSLVSTTNTIMFPKTAGTVGADYQPCSLSSVFCVIAARLVNPPFCRSVIVRFQVYPSRTLAFLRLGEIKIRFNGVIPREIVSEESIDMFFERFDDTLDHRSFHDSVQVQKLARQHLYVPCNNRNC